MAINKPGKIVINKMLFCLPGVAFILSTILPTVASGDSFNQWLQRQQRGVNRQQQNFYAYRDKRDKEFTAFLKAQWKAVDVLQGMRRDTTPKPLVMPVAPSSVPFFTPLHPSPPAVVIPPRKTVPPSPEPAPVVVIPTENKIRINYFGRKLTFYSDGKLKRPLAGGVNKNTVSDYWSALSRANYEALLKQLSAQKKALQLTDWAYAALVDKVSAAINGKGSNANALLSWFLLVKSGYRTRIAYSNQSVYLLVPAKQRLFEVPYFTFSGTRFYAISFNSKEKIPGRVYTYDAQYPGSIKKLDMKVTPLAGANSERKHRQLSFRYRGRGYKVDVVTDRGRIAFFKTYPQLALPLYFSSGVEPETATPLQRQLGAYIRGMDEPQAVNFLLRFVQTALHYKTDEQQFGEENYLFPEETLYYPYSDCEDRAVLFAWLVKSLLGLHVIGLDYPGHVAAAVNFKTDVAGDSVYYKGRKYTVTDPTYINANAGMSMPEYRNTKPGIIAY